MTAVGPTSSRTGGDDADVEPDTDVELRMSGATSSSASASVTGWSSARIIFTTNSQCLGFCLGQLETWEDGLACETAEEEFFDCITQDAACDDEVADLWTLAAGAGQPVRG